MAEERERIRYEEAKERDIPSRAGDEEVRGNDSPYAWEARPPGEAAEPTTEDAGANLETPVLAPPQEASRSKPLVSRALNKLGLSTGPGLDWAIDWIQVLVIAGLLAWGVMSFGMVRMRVPTGSMEPTILPGDSFFVDKFTYWAGLQQPKPGDIIVFWHTENGRMCRENTFLFWSWGELEPCRERYVKRLIAVGGQTVTIRQGEIYVDGERLDDPAFDRDYVCSTAAPRDPVLRDPEGCTWTVPEGKLFVLGDNARNSSDSRYWGFADASSFIGEPFLRVWPPERFGPMNGYFGSAR